MKKILIGTLLILLNGLNTHAQVDQAKSILAEVSKKYKTYNAIKTEFTYTIDNPQAKIKEKQAGTLYLNSKSNKYRVVLNNQEIISDGKSQWTYLKDDKEVQVSDIDNSSDALNPAKIFVIYEKGYKYLYTGDTKINNRVYHNIDLTPIEGSKSFFKVRLQIDKINKRIANAVIFDKNGNHYTYEIKTFTPSASLPEATFAFDSKKYPGVEVVDLR
ncbi:MAG: gliding motility protein [Daejeonella sp.]|nr:gliding motility protein [Daejeonella sp.]